jgi:uncharacterized membrane protein HdeD (DUF308 family)
MNESQTKAASAFEQKLRRLYFIRFAFAVVWALLLVAAAGNPGPSLTILLIAYPLFDAAAVFWQLRADGSGHGGKTSEWANVGASLIVAIALGITSTISISAALVVWGAWAIAAGIPQLLTAIRHRRSGGQVAQILSGGLSVFAGGAFLAQGLQGAGDIVGIGGYAILGGVFFLVSAVRLGAVLRGRAS